MVGGLLSVCWRWSKQVVLVEVGFVVGITVVGRSGDGSRATVVLVLDEAERVEARGGRAGVGIARDATSAAMHIGQAVERHGVTEERAVDEDARQCLLVLGGEAQLDVLAAELRAHFEVAAAPPHGAVLADLACGAMQEDLVELLVPRNAADLVRIGEQVIAWRAP